MDNEFQEFFNQNWNDKYIGGNRGGSTNGGTPTNAPSTNIGDGHLQITPSTKNTGVGRSSTTVAAVVAAAQQNLRESMLQDTRLFLDEFQKQQQQLQQQQQQQQRQIYQNSLVDGRDSTSSSVSVHSLENDIVIKDTRNFSQKLHNRLMENTTGSTRNNLGLMNQQRNTPTGIQPPQQQSTTTSFNAFCSTIGGSASSTGGQELADSTTPPPLQQQPPSSIQGNTTLSTGETEKKTPNSIRGIHLIMLSLLSLPYSLLPYCVASCSAATLSLQFGWNVIQYLPPYLEVSFRTGVCTNKSIRGRSGGVTTNKRINWLTDWLMWYFFQEEIINFNYNYPWLQSYFKNDE